jgi:hypothetical protein
MFASRITAPVALTVVNFWHSIDARLRTAFGGTYRL